MVNLVCVCCFCLRFLIRYPKACFRDAFCFFIDFIGYGSTTHSFLALDFTNKPCFNLHRDICLNPCDTLLTDSHPKVLTFRHTFETRFWGAWEHFYYFCIFMYNFFHHYYGFHLSSWPWRPSKSHFTICIERTRNIILDSRRIFPVVSNDSLAFVPVEFGVYHNFQR